MGWEITPKGGSYACNGDLVRHRRRLRRWTQEGLADITNFSVRLIAKAEAGGSLHPDTIERLAAALSTPAEPLFPEDLIANPKQLALTLLKHIKQHTGQVVSKCQHFLAEDIRYFKPGDPDILPFSGHHTSLDAMDRSCRLFTEFMEIWDFNKWRTEFVVCEGNEVVMGQWVPGRMKDDPRKERMPPSLTFVVSRMVFKRGKIVSMHDYFSSSQAEKEVLECKKLRDEAS